MSNRQSGSYGGWVLWKSQSLGKKQPTVFLLTGSQGIDERMLIPISDFLSAGVLPGIFGQEDRELVYSTVDGDMKVQDI